MIGLPPFRDPSIASLMQLHGVITGHEKRQKVPVELRPNHITPDGSAWMAAPSASSAPLGYTAENEPAHGFGVFR